MYLDRENNEFFFKKKKIRRKKKLKIWKNEAPSRRHGCTIVVKIEIGH